METKALKYASPLSKYMEQHGPVVFRAEGCPMLYVRLNAHASYYLPASYTDIEAVAQAEDMYAMYRDVLLKNQQATDISDGGNAD